MSNKYASLGYEVGTLSAELLSNLGCWDSAWAMVGPDLGDKPPRRPQVGDPVVIERGDYASLGAGPFTILRSHSRSYDCWHVSRDGQCWRRLLRIPGTSQWLVCGLG